MEGIFGVYNIIFPEDTAGRIKASISTSGMLHIVFAGQCSLSTMLVMLLIGFWFGENPRLYGYSVYSFISVAIVFITGGLTAYNIANQTGFGGLFERLTMGAWLQWLFLVGLKIFSLENNERVKT